MFRRPTIAKRTDDDLYQAEVMLLDAEAKLDHARSIAGHHEVNVRVLQERIMKLRLRIAAEAPPVCVPDQNGL